MSGIRLASAPVGGLSHPGVVTDAGFEMPLGIAVPPVEQSYEELERSPPARSPYFGLFLDEQDGLVNHHAIGVDGVRLARDPHIPSRLHVVLLGYEREAVVAHFVLSTGATYSADSAAEQPKTDASSSWETR